jgi:hypothetical protein
VGKPAPAVLLIGHGAPGQIGGCFARALAAIGCRFEFIDESVCFAPPGRHLIQRALDRVFRRPGEIRRFNELVVRRAEAFAPAIVLVIFGRHLEAATLRQIRERTRATLIAYATDNPLIPGRSRAHVLDSIPEYDIYASPRRSSLASLRAQGCRNPVHLRFGYDAAVHFPERAAEPNGWASDVVFIGGADDDRVSMLTPLANSGRASVKLYGRGWSRTSLRAHHGGEVFDQHFRLAMTGARVAPCLVRRSNADGHVMRTFEIPACGQFMIAERTEEHLELFEEGVHAAYFDSAEELHDKTIYYLARDAERERMAKACHQLIAGGQHTYRDRLAELLAVAGA